MKKLETGLKRLETELSYAEKILKLFPDAACAAEIRAVRARLAEQAPRTGAAGVDELVADCESRLTGTAALAKSVTVHCVAHAHIDMNWMWPFDETVAVVQDTFATMLKLMERYPKFTYSQSQASVYKILEEYDPAMLKAVKKRVKEGRWEVPSATWVEGDKNMALGESQVRHILYTKRYFKKIFGLRYDDVAMDFEPDTFGHADRVPAILARGGVKYYYHCRGAEGPKLCRWQAPDGSSIIAYMEKQSWYIKHNAQVEPASIGEFAAMTIGQTGLKDVLFVYGVGDHGGGPTVREIENILQAASWPVFPTVKFSTYGAYFKTVEPHAADLPVIEGEHNFIFTGCYTSQSEIKRANRLSGRHLLEAELFSTLASRLTPETVYPAVRLNDAWESHLFNHFHDILPGSGRKETREYTLGKFQEIIAATSAAKKQALTSIGKLIDTEAALKKAHVPDAGPADRALGAGVGFGQQHGLSSPGMDDGAHRVLTVFNPTQFERSEVVEAVLWDMPGAGRLTVKDSDGRTVAHQILEHAGAYWAHTYKKILFEATGIPPAGYRTFVVYEDTSSAPETPAYWDARLEKEIDLSFDNGLVKLVLDTCSGAVKSLVLKENGKEMAVPGSPLGLFRIIDESPSYHGGMTSWLVGSYARIQSFDGVHFDKTAVINGPLRWGATWTADIRESKFKFTVCIEKGSPAVRWQCACEWLERGSRETYIPQLNVVFPMPFSDGVRTYEVPFGTIARETGNLDVPALRWADISGTAADGGPCGLTVFTDSKHGFRAGKDSIAVSLLRSSYDPDPYPELGEHAFSLAVFPHKGACDRSRAFRNALISEHPLTVFQTSTHRGQLPPKMSFIDIADKNVILSAAKKAEDGTGMIVRLYEIAGKNTEAELQLAGELGGKRFTVTETDSMERPLGKKSVVKDGRITWKIPAHGILTLLLE